MEKAKKTTPNHINETMLPSEGFQSYYRRLADSLHIVQKTCSHMEMCLSSQSFYAWSLRYYKSAIEPLLKRSILYIGPPGTGKTITAKACADHYARTTNSPVVFIELGETRAKFVGESSKNVRMAFDYVASVAEQNKVVLFMDEFDSVGVSRNTSQIHDDVASMVNTLNQHMTRLQTNPNVFIIACSNLEGRIDFATKRRFDFVIHFKRPDTRQRKEVFSKLLEPYCIKENNITRIAKKTKRYTQDDITRVVNLGIEIAFVENVPLKLEHLEEAADEVKPTEGYS